MKSFADITRQRVPLSGLTTFRIGGPAELLVEPRHRNQLTAVLDALDQERTPRRIIGGGSNLLVSDAGVPGAVIRLRGDFLKLDFDGTRVTAGAAVPLARLVDECAARGLSGVEGLVGIPGTVGGALVMNAGGKWGRAGDVTEFVTVYQREGSGSVADIAREGIDFAYRRSSLAGSMILAAALSLARSSQRKVTEVIREYYDLKRRTQDLAARSAGCVFRNPPDGPSAGALIDNAGLKGATIGGARVSDIHANFIVNTGSATQGDVAALISTVQSRVLEHCGVKLDLEIELW